MLGTLISCPVCAVVSSALPTESRNVSALTCTSIFTSLILSIAERICDSISSASTLKLTGISISVNAAVRLDFNDSSLIFKSTFTGSSPVLNWLIELRSFDTISSSLIFKSTLIASPDSVPAFWIAERISEAIFSVLTSTSSWIVDLLASVADIILVCRASFIFVAEDNTSCAIESDIAVNSEPFNSLTEKLCVISALACFIKLKA